MASKDEIRHRVSLEGADDVARRLKNIGDVGSDAFRKVKQAADDSKSGLGNIGNAFTEIGGQSEGGRLAIEKFRETVHTIHPVLDQAGLGLSNLGAFARAAGAGVGGLATAIVGSVLIALAKMGDEAVISKKRLGDLLQNPAGGKSLFEDLKKQASELGTGVSNLLPSMENLIALRNKALSRGNERYAPGHTPIDSPAGGFSNENLFAAQKTLFEALKAGKAPTDEATKALADFTGELARTGQLSTGMVENLAKVAPNAANVLARSLQQGFSGYQDLLNSLEKGVKFSAEEIIRDLVRIGPAVHDALVNAPKETKTFADALDGAKHSASELLDVLKGPNIAMPVLDTLSETLKQDKRDLEGLIGAYQKLKELLARGLAPVSRVGEFLKKALLDPGALQERQRPESGASSLATSAATSPASPPAAAEQRRAVGDLPPTVDNPLKPFEGTPISRALDLKFATEKASDAAVAANRQSYLKENGSFDGLRNPTTEAARARYYNKTFENLPPELQASPVYQKQKLEDEIMTGAHLVGGKSPNVVDGPLAGKESIDRRLTARQIYPSPFDADKRLQYEKNAFEKNGITGDGLPEVEGARIAQANREYHRRKRELELRDYGKAFDSSKIGIADYDKAPPSDYDQSPEHRDAVKQLEFPQLPPFSQRPGPFPSTAPPFEYRDSTPTIPGDPSGIKIRPILEEQRSDAGQGLQVIASAIAGAIKDALSGTLKPQAQTYAAGGGMIGPSSDPQLRVIE